MFRSTRKILLSVLIIVLICCCSAIGIWYGNVREKEAERFTLHLMHTNDLHAHLIPFNSDNRICDYEQPACLGGFARLKTLVNQYRHLYPDMILLDAGDRFSGTVFYSLQKGENIIRLLNEMNYDAVTLGNHEFDDGLSEIEKMMTLIQSPVIVSNVIFPHNSPLAHTVMKSVIIRRGAQKIGVIGLLTDEMKTQSAFAKEIRLRPLLSSVQAETERLKEKGVSVIIVLSHIGFEADKSLAQLSQDIDIIVGGHTHTLLSNNPTFPNVQGVYPTVVQNQKGQPVLIVSAGYGGEYAGQLTVEFNQNGEILSYTGDTQQINTAVQPDDVMKHKIESVEQSLQHQLDEALTVSANPILLTPNTDFCSEECYIGEVLTNTLLQAAPSAKIAFLNAGGIRAGLPKGTIRYGQLVQSYPFDSSVVIVNLTGQEIISYLEIGLRDFIPDQRTNAFLQTAGLSYTFNPLTKKVITVLHNGEPLHLNKSYPVVMASFLARGGDGYPEQPEAQEIHPSLRQLLKQQMQRSDYKFPPFENRITLH